MKFLTFHWRSSKNNKKISWVKFKLLKLFKVCVGRYFLSFHQNFQNDKWQILTNSKNSNLNQRISESSHRTNFSVVLHMDTASVFKCDFFHNFWRDHFSGIVLNVFFWKNTINNSKFWFPAVILFRDHKYVIFSIQLVPIYSSEFLSDFLSTSKKSIFGDLIKFEIFGFLLTVFKK